jgi:hypothetical protein
MKRAKKQTGAKRKTSRSPRASSARKPAPKAKKTGTTRARGKAPARKAGKSSVVLLSGGNPQIAKGYGDAPVQAYIDAIPDWKSGLARRLDALITRAVPNVYKAVKWNSPFYGIEGEGWFLAFHCYTKYLKVTFFRGTSLQPVPPGPSKTRETRYLDIYETEPLDEAQFVAWVKRASQLPGERM